MTFSFKLSDPVLNGLLNRIMAKVRTLALKPHRRGITTASEGSSLGVISGTALSFTQRELLLAKYAEQKRD